MTDSQIISESYRKENEHLHQTSERYGTSGAKYIGIVRPLADWGRKAILDYGCGKETLARSLGPGYRVSGFDPAVPERSDPPVPHPIVVCTDVLEHVEPDYLDNVLKDLRRVTVEKILIAVALSPSSQYLQDGRNAHLILEPAEWWQKKIEGAGFKLLQSKSAERTVNMWWGIWE